MTRDGDRKVGVTGVSCDQLGVSAGGLGVSQVRLLVVGGRGVGKSALTVRYLTKRYIGEYQSFSGQ